jgi:hypothetical protein
MGARVDGILQQKFKIQASSTEAAEDADKCVCDSFAFASADPTCVCGSAKAPRARGVFEYLRRFLPRAHTCFFSLNLPRYSTREIMSTKLKYAILHCVEMDGDFKVTDDDPTIWAF